MLIYGAILAFDNLSPKTAILQQKMFEGTVLPEVETWEDDVDVRSLDQGHVVPNMMPPNCRGIWFPMGYV